MQADGPVCTDADLDLKESLGNKRKLLIGGLAIVAAIIYLVVSSIGDGAAYYLTVGELKAQAGEIADRNVRVSGFVVGESIHYDAPTLQLRFEIADDTGVLPVSYKGVLPDMLQDEAEAVVEGQYSLDGQFEATKLLLKCPSKYEEAATAEAGKR
ncbi:MAG: cytochrome c maturation protein CcmE [Chloroflexi bacterium]|nr:cytochrome c maturation protein CcmE [Chloroflexota bacterium]